jgi:hypothetical protein
VIRYFVREAEAIHGAGHLDAALAFEQGLSRLRMGDLDSAEVWLNRAVHDSTQQNTGIPMWAPAAMTQLRLDQGRVADARREIVHLPAGTHARRVTAAFLAARLRWQEGDSVAALTMLEDSIRTLSGSGPALPDDLAQPLTTAADWRLATGNPRAADSLAALARSAAAIDSLALTRSGLLGRAELVRARALRAEGNDTGAREAASRALVALTNGFGADNRWTGEAADLLADLH